jgi:hypothetical protein
MQDRGPERQGGPGQWGQRKGPGGQLHRQAPPSQPGAEPQGAPPAPQGPGTQGRLADEPLADGPDGPGPEPGI